MSSSCFAKLCCCSKQEPTKTTKKPSSSAYMLTQKEVKDMFDLFDQDRNGVVTRDEILALFSASRLPITQELAQRLIEEFDTNNDNQLDFNEFKELMKKYLSDPTSQTQHMFNFFDADGDGYITGEEFQKSMRVIGTDLKTETLNAILPRYFSPGTNKMDFDGFDRLLKDITKKDR